MENLRCQRITLFCRNFTRWFLLVFTLLIIAFAMLSGAEGYGGGFKGVIQNAPNALPWLLLLIINLIVWKSELAGSIILIVFAIAAGFFFGAFTDNLFALFVITIPLIILAIMLMMYHTCQMRQKKVIEN
ncbi:MAG: hypothetical protein K9M99_10500 [Candidatus Cloacimonetes bacterium]|nr:hypothetical protein [Candidatus Cloacimonadota bacterium]